MLRRRSAFRHFSLTKIGRSAALLVGTAGDAGDLVLTITAATDRPFPLPFPAMPTAAALREAIAARIDGPHWFDDVHGSAPFKRHLTLHYASEIRAELAQGAVA